MTRDVVRFSLATVPQVDGVPAVELERAEAPARKPSRSVLDRAGTFPIVICAFVVLKVFRYFSTAGAGDNDIFWHLRNAQYMIAQRRFPSIDSYSFTATGMPWLSHEWLSELIYFGAFRALHWQGLCLLASILAALAACGVFYLAWRRSEDPLAAGLATMLGTGLMAVGIGPRMHHFGWLCFLGIYAILEQYRLRRTGPLWAIPLLFCLWINLHGSWVFGFAIAGLIFLSGFITNDLGLLEASPWSRPERKKLILAGLASAAAIFINPFGYKMVWYPFEMLLHQQLNLQFVEEWRALTFQGPTGLWVGVTIFLLLVCTAVSGIRWRIDDLAITVFLLYCGLTHERMLLPAGIILPAMLAPRLKGFSSYDPLRERKYLNLTLLFLVVVAIIAIFPSDKRLQQKIDAEYPSGAVTYLRAHGVGGRFLNAYNWGGYLEWVWPEQRMFIDPRMDIFEYKGVLRDYLDLTYLKRPQDVLQKYQLDTILIAKDSTWAVWLDQRQDWRLAYKDAVSVVYIRNREQ